MHAKLWSFVPGENKSYLLRPAMGLFVGQKMALWGSLAGPAIDSLHGHGHSRRSEYEMQQCEIHAYGELYDFRRSAMISM